MINKNSIDELVRQKVAQGEEPHNLSAWANMERMLDGNNPYAKEEKEEKRKPWLFMFLGLFLLSSTLVGGYIYLNQADIQSNTQNTLAQSPSQEPNSVSPSTAIAAAETDEKNPSHENMPEDDFISTTSNTNNAQPISYASNNADNSFDDIVQENRRRLKQQLIEDIYPSQTRASASIASNPINTSKAEEKLAAAPLATLNKGKSTIQKGNLAQAKNQETLRNIEKQMAQTAAQIAATPATVSEPYEEKIKVTEISTQNKLNRYGNRISVRDTNKYEITQQKTRIVVNPRYVELTAAQEEAAQRRNELVSNTPSLAASGETKISSEITQSENKIGLLAANKEQKNKNGFFGMFKKAAQNINQKAINMAHTRFPIYTGMFVGLNAALVNTQHNFGGFQGGLTAMTPLSNTLSLSAEARFIHKNNSGYTVTDNYTTILEKFVDNTSWTKGEIHTYEVDSTSVGHNLNNFYNLEIPVLLNAHIKKVDLYGGINFNYGFRMNVTSSNKSNFLTIVDSASYSLPYAERQDTESNFSTADFGSRLGLGYTIGGAYNFNNKLYLDLRMSNSFWDNTKGAAKQEISDVFFKLPSFQLSLGYRFRDFNRDR